MSTLQLGTEYDHHSTLHLQVVGGMHICSNTVAISQDVMSDSALGGIDVSWRYDESRQ